MRILILIIFCSWVTGAQELTKLHINDASLEELRSLPITQEQAAALFEYVQFQGPIISLYQLREIPEIDQATFNRIKPLITLTFLKSYQGRSRLEDSYSKVEDWTSTEGANEGLIEVWLDRLAEPINVNQATYDDLMALQNVSPVDAVAVLKRQQEGSINYPRALRGAQNLSYWGYRNMVDFFTYGDEDQTKGFHVWYNTVYKTVPSTTSFDEEVGTTTPLTNHPGDLQHKLVLTTGRHWKLGVAYHRQLGEQNRTFKVRDFSLPSGKVAITYRDFRVGPIKFNRIILGNFSATIGQGVVFENTDFFLPRRSGYGWSRRVPGVFPDLSRSQEFALRGLAFQTTAGRIQVMGFLSKNTRDAILNVTDESFSSLITLYPRTNVGYNGSLLKPMLDTVEEVTYGGNLRLTVLHGSYFGFSSYESLYDRILQPDIHRTVIAREYEGKYLTSVGNSADSEIEAMYSSTASSPLWDKAQALRRVFGFEFTTVINNVAFQGEYGILDKDGIIGSFKNDPRALVLNAYLQFNSLNFLVVYRDYDLEYDNPYQRSFSNYQRYKGTIFEDTFYLEDPIYGFLYTGAAQPQAERGLFVSSRFQFHRQFVLTTDFDTWTRVADNARYYRTVLRLNYRPVFNYRINLRQKWQMRGPFNVFDPTSFYARETIVRVQLRLSRMDNIELIYIRSKVDFTQRRRLTLDLASGGESPSLVGSAGTGSEAVGFRVTHNVTERLKVLGQIMIYNGFIWNFEDTDFRVFDSQTDALRWWITVFSRLGDNWALRLKLTTNSSLPITNYAFEPDDPQNVYPDQRLNWETVQGYNNEMDFRIQLDYAF